MADRESDRWMWNAAEHLEDRDIQPIPDDELLAYRRGELSPERRERIEWGLSRSAAARARLIALSGVEDPSRGALRQRVLGDRATRRPWHRRWMIPAAAMLLLAALPAWFYLTGDRVAGPAPARLEFVLSVEGLSDVRSVPGDPRPGNVVSAEPDTWITISLEPQQAVTDELRFALYRPEGERLARVPEGEACELEIAHGAARFRARAAALVPSTPGAHPVYVVASTARTFRQSVAGGTTDPLAVLERATGGRAYRFTIQMEEEP